MIAGPACRRSRGLRSPPMWLRLSRFSRPMKLDTAKVFGDRQGHPTGHLRGIPAVDGYQGPTEIPAGADGERDLAPNRHPVPLPLCHCHIATSIRFAGQRNSVLGSIKAICIDVIDPNLQLYCVTLMYIDVQRIDVCYGLKRKEREGLCPCALRVQQHRRHHYGPLVERRRRAFIHNCKSARR